MAAIPTRSDQPQAARAGAGRRTARPLRAHPADPTWARPALAALLLATALVYLVGLDGNGWGNEFYAAASRRGPIGQDPLGRPGRRVRRRGLPVQVHGRVHGAPALALAYLWAGPPGLGKRVWQLLAGGGALLVTAGWWVAVVLRTPAADRPFVGSSTDNNIVNLILGYNGFGRLTGNEGGHGGLPGPAGAGPGAGTAGRGFGGGGAFGGSGGITRLFSAQYGGQVAWLIPAALIAIVVMLWASRRAGRTQITSWVESQFKAQSVGGETVCDLTPPDAAS